MKSCFAFLLAVGAALAVLGAGCGASAPRARTVGPITGTPTPPALQGMIGDPTAGEIAIRPLGWWLDVLVKPGRLSSTSDREEIRRTIRESAAEIADCYLRELADQPALTGTVHSRFVIDMKGRVRKVHTSGLDLFVGSCIASILRGAQFREPSTAALEVTMPFSFYATEPGGLASYPFREPSL